MPLNQSDLAEIRPFVLKSVSRTGGNPLPDRTLKSGLRIAYRHVPMTESELDGIIKGLEAEGYLVGTTDPITRSTLWGLTHKGTLAVDA